MLAICGNDALRELSSPGKSGSFFYLTQDDRFMIKTVRKSEVKVMLLLVNLHDSVILLCLSSTCNLGLVLDPGVLCSGCATFLANMFTCFGVTQLVVFL
jgi:hypothetical protein